MSASSGSVSLMPRASVRWAGVGMAVPKRVLSNEELAKRVDTTDEWISSRTGIRQRHTLDEGQMLAHLASDALSQALASAKMDPKQLDMVLCATMSPQMVCPTTAAVVVDRIGAVPAGAIDVNAACSGFVYALNMAATMIESGRYRTIGVIGAEALSTITDWTDRRTCILFGDGAGAVVLTAGDDPKEGCLYQSMGSNGQMWGELYCPKNPSDLPPNDKIFSGTYNTLQMNGQAIFKFAVTTLQKATDDALAACGLKPADLSMIVAHQSNARILESARERLGLPPEKLYINIERYGNTSAASVPLCLYELTAAGRLKRGDLVLLVALGGGVTWASSLWRL